MGVCDETNAFTCERCGSDRAGYFCDGCSKVVCSCEDCPVCAKLPRSSETDDEDMQDEMMAEHGLWVGYPC